MTAYFLRYFLLCVLFSVKSTGRFAAQVSHSPKLWIDSYKQRIAVDDTTQVSFTCHCKGKVQGSQCLGWLHDRGNEEIAALNQPVRASESSNADVILTTELKRTIPVEYNNTKFFCALYDCDSVYRRYQTSKDIVVTINPPTMFLWASPHQDEYAVGDMVNFHCHPANMPKYATYSWEIRGGSRRYDKGLPLLIQIHPGYNGMVIKCRAVISPYVIIDSNAYTVHVGTRAVATEKNTTTERSTSAISTSITLSSITRKPIVVITPETTNPIFPKDPLTLKPADPITPETTNPVTPETTNPITPESTNPITSEPTSSLTQSSSGQLTLTPINSSPLVWAIPTALAIAVTLTLVACFVYKRRKRSVVGVKHNDSIIYSSPENHYAEILASESNSNPTELYATVNKPNIPQELTYAQIELQQTSDTKGLCERTMERTQYAEVIGVLKMKRKT